MLDKIRKHYQWVIVVAGFLLCFTGLGFCSGNKGLFLKAVSEALEIPRGVYAISDSLRYVTTSIINLFFGILMIKLGPKVLVGMGMGAMALSCLANSLAENVIGIYLGGILLGFGLTFGGTAFVGYMIKRWCKEKQGTILGLVLCANALGAAVSAPWFASMIEKGGTFGYRNAYMATAIILVVVGFFLVLAFKEAPEPKKLPAGKKPKGNTWEGITFKQALRQPYFYIACACIFLTGAVLQAVSGVATAHMQDVGLTLEYIAICTSVRAVALAVSKFLTGVIYDKKGMRFTMLICDVAAMLMILMLTVVSDSPQGQVIAMVYGIVASMALPLETIMLPLVAGDLFGEKEYAKMLGIFVSVNTAGYAVGPLVSNICFDALGTYVPVFFVYAALMCGVTIAFLFVQKQVKKVRESLAMQ